MVISVPLGSATPSVDLGGLSTSKIGRQSSDPSSRFVADDPEKNDVVFFGVDRQRG